MSITRSWRNKERIEELQKELDELREFTETQVSLILESLEKHGLESTLNLEAEEMTDIWDEKPKVRITANGAFPINDWYDAPKMDAWLVKVKELYDIYARAYKNMTEHAVEQADKLEAIKGIIQSSTGMSVMEEIENYDFEGGTIGTLLSLCTKCNTTEEATRLLELYRGVNESADSNLGYIFGYCGEKERSRLYDLFPVAHPVFGAGFGRES